MRRRAPRVRIRGFAGILGALLVAGPTVAQGWAGITPGQTTRAEVEATYGRPTQERTVTEEGRSTPELTYSGGRVPRGVTQMIVSFGLVRPEGFVPDVVRAVTIYPEPGVFSVTALANGWGDPVVTGTEPQSGRPVLRFREGLLAVLDKQGRWAELMVFGPVSP